MLDLVGKAPIVDLMMMMQVLLMLLERIVFELTHVAVAQKVESSGRRTIGFNHIDLV